MNQLAPTVYRNILAIYELDYEKIVELWLEIP